VINMDSYDLVIIGTGAAGLSAALYAGRYRMRVLVVGEEFGGETATAGIIWNYPGAPGVDGYELMKRMREQAEGVGAEIIDGKVEHIEKDGNCYSMDIKGRVVHTTTIIFAIGTNRRHLNLPNEKELTGRGVHYCVTCDGPLYSGKKIILVGGGDASVKGASLAAEYVDKVYLLVRSKIKAEPINLQEMQKLGDKIEVILETEVKEIIGSDKFEKVKLSKPYNGSDELSADALFIEIGSEPQVGIATELGVLTGPRGYIEVDRLMATNVQGLFAAGDTVSFFGPFKQDITAAATGAVAATSAYNYKKLHGNLCDKHNTVSKKEI
tara:strand:+ start:2968 stop:3939 length:972 start_codon:yes stop_codon:yes gene_type:complete